MCVCVEGVEGVEGNPICFSSAIACPDNGMVILKGNSNRPHFYMQGASHPLKSWILPLKDISDIYL